MNCEGRVDAPYLAARRFFLPTERFGVVRIDRGVDAAARATRRTHAFAPARCLSCAALMATAARKNSQ